jgi:hypothetical protein
MQFAIFFILFDIFLIAKIDTTKISSIFLVWLILNFFIMSIAYLFNQPKLILNKKQNGELNLILLIINLPWLLFTWIVFFIYTKLINEDYCNQIKGTNIWIARADFFNKIENFDIVVDLTAEFFRDNTKIRYISIPNLDGMSLKNYDIDFDITNKKVLVHCANGHGRSSLFVAILLIDNGICNNVEDALALIKKSRIKAYPNKIQKLWIKNQIKQ